LTSEIGFFLDRIKGQISPLSVNNEYLQELMKKGIVSGEEGNASMSSSSIYKGQGGRVLILLNFIEHVRLILSSRKGDMKVGTNLVIGILHYIKYNILPKWSTTYFQLPITYRFTQIIQVTQAIMSTARTFSRL